MLEPKKTVWRALALMLTMVALVGIPTRALASDAPPKTAEEAAEDEPVKPSENRKGEVKEIGLYITNVNKIDVQKESWELEAQLTISSTGRLRKCAVPQIQELFPSGTVKKVDEIDEWEDGPKKFRQCKVSLEHESTIDVSRYPFDSTTSKCSSVTRAMRPTAWSSSRSPIPSRPASRPPRSSPAGSWAS